MINLKDNPDYEIAFESKVHGIKLYVPKEMANGYHMSRYVAAGAQNIFSSSGATKDYLDALTNSMLDICNNEKNNNRLRSDIITLVQNIRVRLRYPVDEDCAIRMGAIYTMLEDENPEEIKDFWTQRKIDYAKGNEAQGIKPDPNLYAFFLSMGYGLTPSWKEQLTDSDMTTYFRRRNDNLQSLSISPSAPKQG